MAISLPVYIDPTRPGYGQAQQIPITGATPPPQGSTSANPDPPVEPINAWLKTQPWYQAAMRAWGKDPNHPSLSTQQRAQIADAAFRAGLPLGSSHDISTNGEWEDVHTTAGKVTALTIAGVAGGVGAAGALSGGGAAGTAVGEGTAPVLEGTAAGTGAATTTAGLGTAPIAAEAGATTGGLSGAALPGATAIPTVADLAGTGSAVAGTNLANGLPAATGPSGFSSLLSTLTSPAVLGTIAQGAFGLYAASQAAGASTDAAKIIADANTAAAKLYSDAQLQAAQIQAQSTANALDFAKQGYAGEVARYNQNQEQLAPYTGAGDAAVTKLSQLMGLGTPPPYKAPVIPPITPTPVPTATTPATTAPASSTTNPQGFSQPVIDAATGRGVAPPPLPSTSAAPAGSIASLSQPLAPQQTGQPMVTLRAPTGEVTQKPAAELSHWLSLGAQQVPGSSVQMGGAA